MALEVAVRNPERYENILRTFSKFEGKVLDDDGILDLYTQLYLDGVVKTDDLSEEFLNPKYLRKWIAETRTHNNEWGFPTGYQAAFTRYLKTLSEFGFIYSQYNQKLRLSPIAKALVDCKITLSEAFAVQSTRFWRKSPYRRVLNDFNFFKFIIDAIIERDKQGHRLSYNQLMVGLFSDDGNVSDYLKLLNDNKIGADKDLAYNLVCKLYSGVDSDHAKASKMESAFRDYGNTVFRVLQLTGFITVEYNGMLMLSPNKNRMPFYHALNKIGIKISETAKESEEEYFELLGRFDSEMESLVYSFREQEDHSTADYNKKIPNIIKSYGLNKDNIEQALVKVSSGEKYSKDNFWFIQDPVKFEFLLTLFVYSYYGDKFVYKPNYICDEAGIPYSHAPGNIGDIEIYNRDKYWLIEATLIRAKTQQINNETVNLFRHIDENKDGDKYLTLVAPYIHDDTRLIFNVATIVTLMGKQSIKLCSVSQTTDDFVETVKRADYFVSTRDNSIAFISKLKKTLEKVSC